MFDNFTENDTGRLLYLVTLLILVASSLVAMRTLKVSQFLKGVLGWVAIAAVIAVLYSFRAEMGFVGNRVAAEFNPARGSLEAGALRLAKHEDGHFYVEGNIGQAQINFLIDTGATDVVLSPSDAQAAGLKLSAEAFIGTAMTANGAVKVAPIRLSELQVGPFVLANVDASVSAGGLNQSLLGMSALSRFAVTKIDGYVMTLEPR
jgi:aspartyl protease family protein